MIVVLSTGNIVCLVLELLSSYDCGDFGGFLLIRGCLHTNSVNLLSVTCLLTSNVMLIGEGCIFYLLLSNFATICLYFF